MRNLREEIGLNAGTTKKEDLLNECLKVKEMEVMSRAYSAFSAFARDLQSIKNIYEPYQSFGPVPMLRGQEQLSAEDKNKIREGLRNFCLNKLEYIKEVVEETFSKKEEEKPEIEVSFTKEE